jgi:HEAT repeat protein
MRRVFMIAAVLLIGWMPTTLFAQPAPAQGPVKLRLIAWRDRYVLPLTASDVTDRAARRQVPAVALAFELENTSGRQMLILGTPVPKLSVKGPRPNSVNEQEGARFYAPPETQLTLTPGERVTIPVRRLSYFVGRTQRDIYWHDAGSYTISGTWTLRVSPPLEGQLVEKGQDGKDFSPITVTSAANTVGVQAGDPVVYWAEALRDKDLTVRMIAVQTINDMGKEGAAATAALVRALRDPSKDLRRLAVAALVKVDAGAEYSGALRELLRDAEAGVRAVAANALVQIAPKEAATVPALLPLLKDADAEVRRCTAEALGHLYYKGVYQLEPAAARMLQDALSDADELVRAAAALALGLLHVNEAIPELTAMVRQSRGRARFAAITALGHFRALAKDAVPAIAEVLTEESEVPPEHGWVGFHSNTCWALRQIGKDSVAALPILIKALDHRDPYLRQGAALVLIEIGAEGRDAVPALTKHAATDADLSTRQYCMQALGTMGPDAKTSVPALTNALKDAQFAIRREAAMALAKIGPAARTAVPDLVALLKNERELFVRIDVARALSLLGGMTKDAVPVLSAALKDPDQSVVLYSVVALGTIGPEAREAVPALQRLRYNHNPHIIKAAAEALQRIGEK